MRIAIANSKGGVGKSTVTVVLADYLAHFHQRRVLVIDLDPQATTSCLLKSVQGIKLAEQQGQTLTHFLQKLREGKTPKLSDFLQRNAGNLEELRPVAQAGTRGRIDLVASVPSLWFEEGEFVETFYRANSAPAQHLNDALVRGLTPIANDYDIVLIDCPPNYSSLTKAGLMLADAVISPTTTDEIALLSLRDFRRYAIDGAQSGRLSHHHYVIATRLGRTNDEANGFDNLRRNFTVVGPPMRYAPKLARAIWMPAPNSRQNYREKYGNFLSGVRSDIEAIGQAVYEKVLSPESRR